MASNSARVLAEICIGLLLHSVLRLSYSDATSGIQTDKHFIMSGKRSANSYRLFTITSAVQCCGRCVTDDTCYLVSYNKQTRVCELTNALPGGATVTMDTVPGWNVYYSSVDDCASTPCQNGGGCTDGIGMYTCACAAGWLGDNCEQSICGGTGWHSDGSSCYLLEMSSSSKQSWDDAKISCEDVDGHLVYIQTEEKLLFLEQVHTDNGGGSHGFWIGAHDNRPGSGERKFFWGDETDLDDTYTNWWNNQPDVYYDERCVEMLANENFQWNDATCSSLKNYICEKEI